MATLNKRKNYVQVPSTWLLLAYGVLTFHFSAFAWEVWHTYSMIRLYGPSAEETVNRLFFERFGVVWLVVPVAYYVLRGAGAAWLAKTTFRMAITEKTCVGYIVSYAALFALFLAGVAHVTFSVPFCANSSSGWRSPFQKGYFVMSVPEKRT